MKRLVPRRLTERPIPDLRRVFARSSVTTQRTIGGPGGPQGSTRGPGPRSGSRLAGGQSPDIAGRTHARASARAPVDGVRSSRTGRAAAAGAGAGASSTVRDLVVGSGLEFEDRGEHELRGIEGRWRLLAVCPERGRPA